MDFSREKDFPQSNLLLPSVRRFLGRRASGERNFPQKIAVYLGNYCIYI
jgi:hypothetical protein